MYPSRELRRLAAHKVALRAAIGQGRVRIALDAARVAGPLRLVDRLREALGRMRRLAAMLRWGPLVFSVFRALRSRFADKRG